MSNPTRLAALLKAADLHWNNSILNESCCFYLEENGYFCGDSRCEHVQGSYAHPFVTLADLLREVAGTGYKSVTLLAADNPNLAEYLGQLERELEAAKKEKP